MVYMNIVKAWAFRLWGFTSFKEQHIEMLQMAVILDILSLVCLGFWNNVVIVFN